MKLGQATHVVDDDRAPDVVPRVLLRDPDARFTDDDPQLALVVQRVGHPGMRVDLGFVARDGRCALGEDDYPLALCPAMDTVRPTRLVRVVVLDAGVEARRLELP